MGFFDEYGSEDWWKQKITIAYRSGLKVIDRSKTLTVPRSTMTVSENMLEPR